MMGGPPPGFMRDKMEQELKEPLPKNIKEVPGYLKRLIGGFLYRLFYIFGLVWEVKPWILFLMLFMSVFNGVMPVVGAYISANLINGLVAAVTGEITSFSIIVRLLIFQFAYIFLNSFVNTIYNMIIRISGELVTNHIKLKIIDKAKTVDLASFDLPSFYEKMENANREAGNRPIQILSSTFNIISTAISMISFVVILAAISPFAPMIIIAISVPTAIINFIYRKKNFLYMRRRSKDRRQMNYFSGLLTNKDMVKEIRIFGLSETFIQKYKETFKKYFAGIQQLIVHENIWHVVISIVTNAVNCALFLYIAYRVFTGDLEVGDYSLYTGALNSISGGVSSLIHTTAAIYEGTLFIENMIAFMKEKQHIIPRLAEPLHVKKHCGHTIDFENVSFSYPGTGRPVIHNINLHLGEGESVALVGLNGAGKTTLIKLLTRLYDPTEGRILLDGQDIRDYDLNELYSLFGIIFQDFGKYAVTVNENIVYGSIGDGYNEEKVNYASKQSNADVFIEKLPHQYETPLMRYFEDSGIELSIGQWQKLSIARAFYSDSDILILDEPTASLDPMAEQEIFNQFDNLRKDKTTIFVSHRLSSATTVSKIVVLENGQIIEEGTHAALMKKQGKYYELFSTQAKRYIASMEEMENEQPSLPHGDFPPMPGGSLRDGEKPSHPHPGRPPHGFGHPPHGDRPPFPPDFEKKDPPEKEQ